MSSLGQTLRQAREAKGLTQSQVAAQTRILIQIIDDIENEDFHRIAAPIYGRGFVRLYAECVDLDPQPLIREFMDIYEGRRAPTVLVRDIPTEAPASPTSTSEPEAAPLEPPTLSIDSGFAQAPVEEPVVTPASVPEPTDVPDPFATSDAFAPNPLTETPVPSAPVEEPPAQDYAIRSETEIPPQQPPFTSTSSSPFISSSTETTPLWDPQKKESNVAQEPAPIVRGLDLFDQAAGRPPASPDADTASKTSTPASNDTRQTADTPFLPPIYEDNGPSAAERFKSGISSVSHGVLRSVRKIPRSIWRKALLIKAAILLIAIIVFGCVKLYKLTTPAPVESCEGGSCEYNPKVQPTSATPAPKAAPRAHASNPATKKTATRSPAANAVQSAAKASGKLHSTGQQITPLYID